MVVSILFIIQDFFAIVQHFRDFNRFFTKGIVAAFKNAAAIPVGAHNVRPSDDDHVTRAHNVRPYILMFAIKYPPAVSLRCATFRRFM